MYEIYTFISRTRLCREPCAHNAVVHVGSRAPRHNQSEVRKASKGSGAVKRARGFRQARVCAAPAPCGLALLHSASCWRWVLVSLRGRPGGAWDTKLRQALAEILMAGITHGLLTEREHLSHIADALALRQDQEGMEAFDQLQRTAGIDLLETTRELLAGEGAQASGKGHEGYLLRKTTTTGLWTMES